MNKWEYGGYYHNYDMTGEIKTGTGIVQVHDIFNPTPDFMKTADCIFVDPPCSQGNLTSFYTKADKLQTAEFTAFEHRLFQVIDEIQPERVFMEVFRSNKEKFFRELEKRFESVRVYETTYYHNKKNRCWILHGCPLYDDDYPFDGMDEEDCIEYICHNAPYEVIGDPCMGQGLVGFHANVAGKKFVGTELNEKRLAVLLKRIETGNLKCK